MPSKLVEDFAHVYEPFRTAQFAVLRRPAGARYILAAPGKEDGWVVDGPMVHQYFATEEEARAHAVSIGLPNAVYPSFGGYGTPFGTVLLLSPLEQGVVRMTVEEFEAEWQDYVLSAEEINDLKGFELARDELTVRPADKRDDGSERPTAKPDDPTDDAFIEVIDPLAPQGPGSGPNTGPDPSAD